MKGYRSHIVNGLAMIAAILMMPGIGDIIPPEHVRYVPLVQGAIAIIMRQLTTTPPGETEDRRGPDYRKRTSDWAI